MNKVIELDLESEPIMHLMQRDKRLAKVILQIGPLTYSVHSDGYVFLLHEIIEQMLSIKAGKKIFERLQTLCGGQITPNVIGQLTDEQIRSAGISNAKVGFIRNITRAVQENALNFDKLANQPDEEVMKQLTAIKGIGNWTAKMYLIFVLNRMDILPYEDGAFLQSYRWLYKPSDSSSKAIKKKCNKWRPFSSIAARYLYVALNMGLTKSEFHLFKNLEV